MFIRGFRVTRTFRTSPKQPKVVAGFFPDPDSCDFEPDIEVVSDPLYILLDYIAEVRNTGFASCLCRVYTSILT